MKIELILTNGVLMNICPYFEDSEPWDSRRQICIGSRSCTEDCIYINEYNKIEKYVICNKWNEIDRKNKLNSI